ncbi:MAG: dUTP diphosphatase [Aggregatilineales bacterium]
MSETVLKIRYTDDYKQLDLPPITAPRDGDAGYDLRTVTAMTIAPGEQVALPAGVHLEIPAGFVGLVKDRSSMAKRGFTTSAGVIDSGYRGQVLILIRNQTDAAMTVEQGERIAQLLILPAYTFEVEVVDELTETERGTGGFGSTGRN